MGVEPYLVASSLVGVVAQRLLRRVCSNCSEPTQHKPDLLAAIGLTGNEPNANYRRGKGCEKCQGSGYKGRQGLYELLIIDETIKRMTVDRSSSSAMKNHAIEAQGMRTLLGDGRLAVLAGKTTPEEVLRVSQREDF
jgi:type II secretory ATPase GspE/PulE/Tfp pilus assembly ATPase PilB-like protein